MRNTRRHLILLGATGLLEMTLTHANEPLYRRASTGKLGGTSKEGEALLSPKALVATFGAPTEESWDAESLGAYYFLSQAGRLFTVYCRAYDHSSRSVRELRKSFWVEARTIEFSIGSHGPEGVGQFIEWLTKRVAK